MALPLRITVATTFAVLAIVSVSVVAAVNFLGGRESIRETASLKIAASVETAQETLERLLVRSSSAAESIANLPDELFVWQRPEPLLSALMVALQNQPDVYGVFVGFPDGAFVQAVRAFQHAERENNPDKTVGEGAVAWRTMGPALGSVARLEEWRHFDEHGAELHDSAEARRSVYDPRTRPWFQNALGRYGVAVTDPYVFESLQQPGVTISHAVRAADGTVVGVDLALGDLSLLAERLRPGDNGKLTILDADGRVIAGTLDFLSDKLSAAEIPRIGDIGDPLLAGTARATEGAPHRMVPFEYGGEDYIGIRTFVSASAESEWTILAAAATSDFTGGLETTLYNSLIISGVILLISIGIVTAMAGWISRPVLKLRTMADQITRLNLSKVEAFSSPFTEISQLQTSMDRMRNALDTSLRFIPQDVVREQLLTGKTADVGGTRREVTLLFTDIEGFTTISEKLTPEQIMSQVSVYFEQLSFAIQCNRGVIDKYIGDAIMAMWNAPAADEDHVSNSCRAVLTARQLSWDLNEEFATEGLPALHTRFGLHSCEALVGNVGAPDRMQYTCLGAGVNLASRIEGLNKHYGTQILASDSIRRKAGAAFLFRRIDIVRAKGTTRPIVIYELLGERNPDDAFFVGPETVKWASQYEQAFDFYLHRDFPDAITVLEGLIDALPDDRVIAKLLEKCRAYAVTPPPPEWDGSTALDEK